MKTSVVSSQPPTRPPRGFRLRRGIAAPLGFVLVLTSLGVAGAATEVTVRNPGNLTAVGPVNTEHGYPAWYEDSNQVRTELCLDAGNPLCGFLPGDVPDPAKPISFPENFPSESFYMLAGSELALPGGGRAVLVLALEAAFANENPIQGDQVVFGRQRITVRGAPANTTLTFQHPYGTVTVDTDASGAGKLVEDVSPAIGNFQTPLKSDIGPFLRWDSGAPEGYLGDPGVEHTITGSPLDQNYFSVSGGGLDVRNDLFSVMGKIATNTGVQANRAVLNDGYIDVFATSRGDQLQVDGQEGVFETTPMEKDEGDSEEAYARIAYTGTAPTSVTVRNLGDDPVSTSQVPVSDISAATATYDGEALSVEATSSSGAVPAVAGHGDLAPVADRPNTYRGTFTTAAPPVEVTVSTSGTSRLTVPVVVTGGEASPLVRPAPAEPAPVPVTPAAVVFADNGGTDQDTYTIPSTTGVEYLVGDAVVAAGTYPGTGTVTVTARATAGHVLAEGATSTWTTAFSAAPAEYVAPAVSPFVDVPTSHVFYKEIAWTVDRGIASSWTTAAGGQEYRPTLAVDRASAAVSLYRMAGSPAYTAPAVSPFVDVPTTHPSYKEIAWMAEKRISGGWSTAAGKEFRPSLAVNREITAAFLYRMAGSPVHTAPAVSPFVDVPTTHPFYKEITWMAEKRISGGWSTAAGKEFRPGVTVTRDVSAAFLYRLSTVL